MATRSTFSKHRRFKRFRSESGISLIHVALLLFVMMGLSMFVTDFGVLWLARGQAQNAADAGALAGAISLALDPTDFSTTGPAYTAATDAATTNLVFGAAPTTTEVYVDPATYGSWVPSPVPPICTSVGGCVQVNVYRTGMPTWFANVFGINSQQIRATATAQARGGNSVRCLKPFGIMDKWAEARTAALPPAASDGVWHSGEDGDTPISTFDRYYAPTGSTVALLTTPPPLDSYTAPTDNSTGTSFLATPMTAMPPGDLGRKLALAVGVQNDRPPMLSKLDQNPFVAGWFIPVTWGSGAPDWKSYIKGCVNETVSIHDPLNIDNDPGADAEHEAAQAVGCGPPDLSGCDAGVWKQDTDSLYNQDPGAHWVDGQGVVGSAFGVSPRVVPAALIDPADYIEATNSGRSTVVLQNIIGLFIDGFRVSDRKIVVHVVKLPGEYAAGGGTVSANNSFLQYISLVR